jgi:protein SCO1/2
MILRSQTRSQLFATNRGFANPRIVAGLAFLLVCGPLVFFALSRAHDVASASQPGVERTFRVTGLIQEVQSDQNSVVISHQAIPGYMGAMTMPFHVQKAEELVSLLAGDEVSFRLSVTESKSWIDQIHKVGRIETAKPGRPEGESDREVQTKPRHPLLEYSFTNELGQAVRLRDFQGQALAISFFFTRCPIPDFCPRLSKNFAEASLKLIAQTDAPTNWHFLSVSFDPEFDSPSVLKAYAERYQYDPSHWSFLTGPKDKIAELARLSNVQFEPDSGSFNHNFRTLVIDASGRLQMAFPTGGDLSEAIVSEVLKAAVAGKNKPS